MMSMVLAKVAAGDPESINTLALLRVLGFEDKQLHQAPQKNVEPNVEEIPIWQILDMCVAGAKLRKRDYWLQRH